MVNKVGLIVIFTGKYKKYLPRFIETWKQKFMPGKADLYVLCDKRFDYPEKNIYFIPINHLGWPNCTLKRYEIISKFSYLFKNEYLYSIDGDVWFKEEVLFSEIKGDLVGILHRNIERKRKDFNYETRPESTAYIADDEGDIYFAGGLTGGKRENFLKMAETIRDNMNADIEKGIRAIWGDQSHLNRYFIDNPPDKILSPVYMCSDYLDGKKFNGKIIHVTKDFKKLDIKDIKQYLNIDPKEFEDLKIYNPRILITGHKGFIGKRLFDKLKKNFTVEGVDLKSNVDILSGVLPDSIDIVFHLAAQAGAITSQENPGWDARSNIMATLKIIEKYPNSRIIFPTSGAAEEPESPYGLSKKTAEEYIKILCDDYVILRLSSIYGEKPKGVVDSFIRGNKCTIYGDGEAVRDFVHVDDIVDAFIKSADLPKGTYSCGNGKGTRVIDIAKATGKEIEYKPERKGEKKYVVLQNNMPNWEPKINVLDYVKKCTKSTS